MQYAILFSLYKPAGSALEFPVVTATKAVIFAGKDFVPLELIYGPLKTDEEEKALLTARPDTLPGSPTSRIAVLRSANQFGKDIGRVRIG